MEQGLIRVSKKDPHLQAREFGSTQVCKTNLNLGLIPVNKRVELEL